jgi:predicted acylesterase/phospholipase RssA
VAAAEQDKEYEFPTMNRLASRWFPAVLTAVLAMSANVGAREAAPVPGAAPPDRPRVGLVLGGGGARGAAHIGVLRELERLHIPIDAITGTSMGAIVGGLYASGKSPAELEQIVASVDWADGLSDEPDRSDLRQTAATCACGANRTSSIFPLIRTSGCIVASSSCPWAWCRGRSWT